MFNLLIPMPCSIIFSPTKTKKPVTFENQRLQALVPLTGIEPVRCVTTEGF